MNTSTRLIKYIVPYSSSIIAIIILTVLMASCEMAYVSLLAETIDAIKIIDTNGLPTSVSFFKGLSARFGIGLYDSTEPSHEISFSYLVVLGYRCDEL